MGDVKELQLIGPKAFKEQFAKDLSVNSVRDLFNSEGFPSVKIGSRSFTTEAAAKQFLKKLGQDPGPEEIAE